MMDNSLARHLALGLVRHAGRILRQNRSAWADAMEREIHYIEGDWSACSWAVGCVAASYLQRAKAEYFFLPYLAKMPFAFLILTYSLAEFVRPMNSAWCHLTKTPRPSLPYLNFGTCTTWTLAIPFTMHIFWIVTGCLYFMAVVRLLQNSRMALRFFMWAWLADIVSFALAQTVPAIALWWKGNPILNQLLLSLARNYLLFPSLVAIALWLLAQLSSSPDVAVKQDAR